MNRLLFIVNPTAGAGRARVRWAELIQQWDRRGHPWQVEFTSHSGGAGELARKYAHDYAAIVAVGGDGTASEVAGGILDAGPPQPALGLVPVGTGNDVARGLGIRDATEALGVLETGRLRRLDAIAVKCVADGQPVVRHALGFAAAGIIGELLRQTTPSIKRLCGRRLAYYIGLLLALWRYRPPGMRVVCDGEPRRERFLFVCASNGETVGGGMRIAPEARVDDGVLDINLIAAVGRCDAIRHLSRLRHGTHITHPKVSFFRARSMMVETEAPMDVAIDGDLIGFTPARFETRPAALRVLVPASGSATVSRESENG